MVSKSLKGASLPRSIARRAGSIARMRTTSGQRLATWLKSSSPEPSSSRSAATSTSYSFARSRSMHVTLLVATSTSNARPMASRASESESATSTRMAAWWLPRQFPEKWHDHPCDPFDTGGPCRRPCGDGPGWRLSCRYAQRNAPGPAGGRSCITLLPRKTGLRAKVRKRLVRCGRALVDPPGRNHVRHGGQPAQHPGELFEVPDSQLRGDQGGAGRAIGGRRQLFDAEMLQSDDVRQVAHEPAPV